MFAALDICDCVCYSDTVLCSSNVLLSYATVRVVCCVVSCVLCSVVHGQCRPVGS